MKFNEKMEKITLQNFKLYKIRLKAVEKQKYFNKINEIFCDLLIAISETDKYLVINDISEKMLSRIVGFWGGYQRIGYDSYKCKITAYLIKRIYKLFKKYHS